MNGEGCNQGGSCAPAHHCLRDNKNVFKGRYDGKDEVLCEQVYAFDICSHYPCLSRYHRSLVTKTSLVNVQYVISVHRKGPHRVQTVKHRLLCSVDIGIRLQGLFPPKLYLCKTKALRLWKITVSDLPWCQPFIWVSFLLFSTFYLPRVQAYCSALMWL